MIPMVGKSSAFGKSRDAKKMADSARTPPFLLEQLSADKARLRGNCIEASYCWARSRAWRESTNNVPCHQAACLESRSNQRLYVPLGSPPSVAVGSLTARAAVGGPEMGACRCTRYSI